ncbi:hypothetical protein GJ496_001082 [Pomphorhynchus laevis]|nr:hypothetical protein GJ496_001082 [Pomphorhynchus laevis]
MNGLENIVKLSSKSCVGMSVTQSHDSRNHVLRLPHRAVRVWSRLPQYVIELRDNSSFEHLATFWIAKDALLK